MIDLLQKLILADRRLIKLTAELLNSPAADLELKTQVQFQLTPQAAAGDDRRMWPMRAALNCEGVNVLSKDESKSVFAIQCVMQLNYQQVLGENLRLEEVQQSHMSLSRQAYPILIDKAQPLLQQLGLLQVRLPMDMLQVASSSNKASGPLH